MPLSSGCGISRLSGNELHITITSHLALTLDIILHAPLSIIQLGMKGSHVKVGLSLTDNPLHEYVSCHHSRTWSPQSCHASSVMILRGFMGSSCLSYRHIVERTVELDRVVAVRCT